MSIVDDPGYYFQTNAAIANSERKAAKSGNENGAPLKLGSKILAVQPGDSMASVFVAEATGQISRLDTETSDIKKIAAPAAAPLTSLTVCAQSKSIYAGSWDKNIYGIPLDRASGPRRKLTGHTDFIKCVLATSLGDRPILLSGGADAVLIVWDLTTGTALHKLKGHTKALQALAIDPLSRAVSGESEKKIESLTVFSASSDREIRRWHISLADSHELPDPILAHDTSVYALTFDSEGDLWTASADKTARHLVRDRNWAADTTLSHPDFVRDVLVAEQLGVVVTACRDEEVRIWDLASGDLVCTYTGHFEEVTGLVLLNNSKVLSVSIDGTARQWPLDRAGMQKYLEDLDQIAKGEKNDGNGAAENMLTAEEEAELAELMDEDED